REATAETYREKFKKLGLEIDDEDAKQIQSTVNKIFEMPTEKIKLDDDFLKNVAGGNDSPSYEDIDTPGGDEPASSDKQALAWGIGGSVAAAAWLFSGVGCAIAASVYRKQKDKEKFHKCATASFHILNAPLLPVEVAAGVAFVLAAGAMMQHGLPASSPSGDPSKLVTHPVETIFGVNVE
ncbi:MAG: hypothetical protein IKE41_00430, partial [Clostridia bacterium]|nr:hypothetical protein [Clostridia bacterium]